MFSIVSFNDSDNIIENDKNQKSNIFLRNTGEEVGLRENKLSEITLFFYCLDTVGSMYLSGAIPFERNIPGERVLSFRIFVHELSPFGYRTIDVRVFVRVYVI